MESIRRNRDIVSIKRTIWSNFDKFRTISVFYLERNTVLENIAALPDDAIAKIAAECREGGVRWRNFLKFLNPDSLRVVSGYVEPALAEAKAGERFQFERTGYFVCDAPLVFNRTCSLKDSYRPA